MILLEQRTTRLSLAVLFKDELDPDIFVKEEQVCVKINETKTKPVFHHAGYWLFMDLSVNPVTISWTSVRYESGEQVVDLETLPALMPVISALLVLPPPVTITLTSMSRGAVGMPYERLVTTSGGKPPLFFEAVNLPPGLTIDSSTGLVSGIPRENIRVYVTVKVRDINYTHDEITKRITILE